MSESRASSFCETFGPLWQVRGGGCRILQERVGGARDKLILFVVAGSAVYPHKDSARLVKQLDDVIELKRSQRRRGSCVTDRISVGNPPHRQSSHHLRKYRKSSKSPRQHARDG